MLKTGFVGTFHRKSDQKNRISLPSKHVKYIQDISSQPEYAQEVMLRMGNHNCIEIFTVEAWHKMVESFDQNTSFNGGNNPDDVRPKSSLSDNVKIDAAGRIMINSNLKADAKIKKKVVFIGVIDRIELWALEKWDEYNKKKEANDGTSDSV